jgi:hypothetical protein
MTAGPSLAPRRADRPLRPSKTTLGYTVGNYLHRLRSGLNQSLMDYAAKFLAAERSPYSLNNGRIVVVRYAVEVFRRLTTLDAWHTVGFLPPQSCLVVRPPRTRRIDIPCVDFPHVTYDARR